MIMTKIVSFTIALFAVIAFVSCEKETLLTVDQTSISFTDAGGSQTVMLTANKTWSVSSTQSWCKVSPSGGEEAAGSRITISCDANTTYDARNCTVTFTCAEMTKSVTISQATNNGLQVSQTTYEVTKAAQQLNIEVKANVKFSVEVDNGCKDWVKYNSTKALTTSTVVLDIAENKTYDGREGKVTIKQDGGSLSSTITIKQSQLDGLFLSTSEYNLSNEKHTLTVEVSTNVEFDVKPEADWVKYVQTKGLSTKQIVLEVAENDTYDHRETKVNVKQKNGDLCGTITIKQDEKYGILVSQSEYNLTNEAQTIDVEVKYNVDFEVSIPDGCKDWIKQVSTKGLSTKNYTFSIAKNETYDNREGSITFKQKKGSLSGTVAIKQAQTDYLEVAKNEYTVDIEGETISIEVTTNVDYTVSISDDAQSWLSKVGTKGLSKDNVQIAVAAGNDNTDRKGVVVISYGDLKRTIKVHQYSYAANTTIQFADEKVKAKLVESFDTNNDGELSIKEARGVKSIEGVFGAVKTYTSFDEFEYFTNVEVVPNNMFKDWRLTSIKLPASIKSIGKAAFKGCSELKSVSYHEGITDIGQSAFDGCSSLIDFNIPSSIKSLGDFAFQGCSSLTTLSFPIAITHIPEGVCYGCSNLTSVYLSEQTTEISEGRLHDIEGEYYMGAYYAGCFANCTNLVEINLPESLVSLGSYAFQNCTNLSNITLPQNITILREGVFAGCKSLTDIIIPEKVTRISEYYDSYRYYSRGTFHGCTNLVSVNIPSKTTIIGENCFSGCFKLTPIILPDSLQEIGYQAFSGCSSLVKICIPENVSKIGYGAFGSCTSLEEVILPESITTIENNLFNGCVHLSSIIIPDCVKYIGNYVFERCTSLLSITIPNSVVSIGLGAFYNCYSLSSVSLPEGIQIVGGSANGSSYGCFENCTSLKSLTIPSTVTYLGWRNFYNCSNLESLIIKAITPPKLENDSAFYGTNNCPIFVPSVSLEQYKVAKNWTYYSERIQPITE